MRTLEKYIPNLPADTLNQKLYGENLHAHMYGLFTFALNLDKPTYKDFLLDSKYYSGIQHLTFERSEEIEGKKAKEINWQNVNTLTENFIDRIDSIMKPKEKLDIYNYTLNQTKDYVENFFIYENMFPDSIFNPYFPLIKIYKRGILVNYTDNESLLSESLNKKISLKGFLKSNSPLEFLIRGKENRHSVLNLGSKYNIQIFIFNLLSEENTSSKKPKSIQEMLKVLSKNGIEMKYDTFQINITTPLKKTGLIGSTNEGFFKITNAEDLIASYCFHAKKGASISHILEKYNNISDSYNIDDLENECYNL